jgi:uncharacterized protein (DUF1015 family)
MAEIAPFRGLRYNPAKVRDLADVVIPPYDVITASEQRAYHRLNPYNMIRLELGEKTPDDRADNNPHTRAAIYLEEWLDEGILVRDEIPSIYYYELDYSMGPLGPQTRCGFICALRLEEFSSGMVRPHEKTFQAIKDERLGLMLSSHANLSPVFALYDDPQMLLDSRLRSARESAPVIRFTDGQGMEHRVWRVTDVETLRQGRALLKEKDIFIADGHHRYETAINYRDIQRSKHKDASSLASFEYIMVYLANLNQGGLAILPTHRMLRNLDGLDSGAFLKLADSFFHISSLEAGKGKEEEWSERLAEGGSNKETVIGFYGRGEERFYLLKAKRDAIASYLKGLSIPPVLHDLDVVVLDQVVLRHLLRLSERFLADENNIHFKHDLIEGLGDVRTGVYEAGFFINATRIEQVQEVARAGLIMPHKSTYFYPKVGSGIVVRSLNPEEKMLW